MQPQANPDHRANDWKAMITLLLRGQHEIAGSPITLPLQQLHNSCDYFAAMLRFTAEQQQVEDGSSTSTTQELDTGD